MTDGSPQHSGNHLPHGNSPSRRVVVDPRTLRWLARAVAVLFVLGLGSAFVRNANGPADPYLEVERNSDVASSQDTLAARGARAPFQTFAESPFRITLAEAKTAADHCALLADTAILHAKGMMEQSDFAGYAAMIFAFQTETSGLFFMRNTRLPLSIAFFDNDGAFVSSADMDPCPDEVVDCPLYGADRPYRYALEAPKGALAGLGIGPGAVLSLTGTGCTG